MLLHQVFIIFQDNMRPHTADDARDWLLQYDLQVLHHPPCGPVFTTFDFLLF